MPDVIGKVTSTNLSTLPIPTKDGLLYSNKLLYNLHHKKSFLLQQPDEEMTEWFNYLTAPERSIKKLPQSQIELQPGGVVGDRHFRAPEFKTIDGQLYRFDQYSQVSFLGAERYTELNQQYGTSISAGDLGENIQTVGITNFEKMSVGTIICVGDSVQIKITNLRSFCFKFANVLFPTIEKYLRWRQTSWGAPIPNIGVIGQVLHGGIVKPGDDIKLASVPDHYTILKYVDKPNNIASKTPITP
jgi:hypothetical protein